MENKAEAAAPLCPCPASIRRKAEKIFHGPCHKEKKTEEDLSLISSVFFILYIVVLNSIHLILHDSIQSYLHDSIQSYLHVFRQSDCMFPCILFTYVSFVPDHIDYIVDILLADIVRLGFDHDADHGLCAALTHQDPSGITKLISHM